MYLIAEAKRSAGSVNIRYKISRVTNAGISVREVKSKICQDQVRHASFQKSDET